MVDIYDRINSGEFKAKTEILPYPTEPSVLKKPASQLTDVEIASLLAVKYKYEEDKVARKASQEAYYKEEGERLGRFWEALAEDFGVDPSDPFVQTMNGLAWERGHSGGLGDVVSAFDDLMPLYKLYKNKRGADE